MKLFHIGSDVYINLDLIIETDFEQKSVTLINGNEIFFSQPVWDRLFSILKLSIVNMNNFKKD